MNADVNFSHNETATGAPAIRHSCAIFISALALLAASTVTHAGPFKWDEVNVSSAPAADKEDDADSGTNNALLAIALAGIPTDTANTQQHNLGLIMALAGMIDLPEEIRRYNQATQLSSGFSDPKDVFGKNWALREPLLFPILSSQQYHRPGQSFYELAINMAAAEAKSDEAVRRYTDAISRMSAIDIRHDKLYNSLMHIKKVERITALNSSSIPESPDACYKQANQLAGLGRVREAINLYREALRMKPDYAEAHNNLGNALASIGQHAQAAEQYREALRLKPDYPIAHSNLGNALTADGKVGEAIGHYEEAVLALPASPHVHNNYGEALIIMGKTAEAIAQFREALRLKPDLTEAKDNLAKALETQKNE